MALGRIIRDKNFFYLNGETLYDVQSIDASMNIDTQVLNILGHGVSSIHNQGVLNANLSIDRLAINNDPFTGLFPSGFSGVWHYIDSEDVDRNFTIHSGYISDYNFSAEIQQIPTISTTIQSYGNMIGGTNVPTGDITTDVNGFLENYVPPKGITLSFDDGELNRVQSFDLSISVNRNVRDRIGQLYSIPETFISYPISVDVSMNIEVDEYSAPKIDSLICRETEDISLELTNCDGSTIRTFTFESGKLNSVSLEGSADGSNNSLNLNYIKFINDVNEVENIFKALT